MERHAIDRKESAGGADGNAVMREPEADNAPPPGALSAGPTPMTAAKAVRIILTGL
jgi:hypothetical protein